MPKVAAGEIWGFMRGGFGKFDEMYGEDGALKLTVRLPPEREGAFTARFPEAERRG